MHSIVISSADKRIKYIFISMLSFLIIAVILNFGTSDNEVKTCISKKDRIDYFSDNGWLVDGDSEQENDTVIPRKDSKIFADYNRIQIRQGYNLCEWSGKCVKKYTYSLMNYPGYENSPSMYASVFIYGEKIIASDIKNISIDGFIEGVRNRAENGKTEN